MFDLKQDVATGEHIIEYKGKEFLKLDSIVTAKFAECVRRNLSRAFYLGKAEGIEETQRPILGVSHDQ